MAKPGRAVKPLALAYAADGKKGDAPPPEINRREGALDPPKKLTKGQEKLWKEYIDPAWWLDDGDKLTSFMLVFEMDKYLKHPGDANAAKIGQLRRLLADLHLTTSERARIGIGSNEADPAEEFFND